MVKYTLFVVMLPQCSVFNRIKGHILVVVCTLPATFFE